MSDKRSEMADKHLDTFAFIFRLLRAHISAPVNPKRLKLTCLESEDSFDSIEADFNPSTLERQVCLESDLQSVA